MNEEKEMLTVIEKAALTIMSYCDDEGFPVSKALLKPRKQDGLKAFWFSTNTSTNKIKCLKKNPKASLYFVNQIAFEGVSLSGTMEILTGDEIRNEIWREGDDWYYPEGVDDPDYTVLKFTTIKGRFYHDMKSDDFII